MSYTLHYFGANGRATIPRAILTYAKAKWTDDRVKQEDWPKIKKSGLCEFEQMPILEIDGKKKLSQSLAIDLYLLKTFNLYGKNIDEQYQIDSLLCSFDDLFGPLGGFVFCPDEKKKEELKKDAIDKLKFFAERLEKRYVSLGKGKYFLGDHFTAADVYLASGFYNMCHILKEEGNFEKYAPNLCALIKRVKGNELKVFFEKYYVDGAPF